MSSVVRFSVSLEPELLEEFDRFCKAERFATRSEAVRQMIHEKMTRRAWHSDSQTAAGTLTIVYDHHRPQLRDRLMELQHDNTDLIISTLHAHLDHATCLEVIVLSGPAGRLQKLASQLRGMKGIVTGELVMAASSTAAHGHPH